MRTSSLLALVAGASSALAQFKGFNYGSASPSGQAYGQSDFEAQFRAAASLQGTSGFTSARLFTMVQAGTQNTVISAIPAALSTNTKLLLGLWGSGGDAAFANELQALKTAIQQFPQLSSSLVGISVGSEDLYRISPAAAAAGSVNPGAEPTTLVNYVRQVREAISGTAWSAAPIGHVDTWTAFANGSNDAVSAALDFVGVDAYPYFQTADANAVENGATLFQRALDGLTATAKSKQIWITETGWPVKGNTLNQAVPGTTQAKKYWDLVGCGLLFGKFSHVFWYTLLDSGSPDPSFGVVGPGLSTTPLYDLSCPSVTSSSTTAAATSASSAAASSAATSAASPVINAPSSGSSATSTVATTSAAASANTTATSSASASSSTAAAGGATTVVTTVATPSGATGSATAAVTTVVTNTGVAPAGTSTTAATSTRPALVTGAAAALDAASGALLAIIAGGAALAL